MGFSKLVSLTACLMICIQLTEGFGTNFWKFRSKVEEHRKQKAKEKAFHHYIQEPLALLGEPYPEHYHTQPLDHFDPLVKDTYQQRYWLTDEYWKKPDGPVFLYIGGEGALSSMTVQAGEHMDLAKKYGALVFAVEHRFYGESLNDDGLELKNLQYLSSQQALADLASFHTFVSKEYSLTEKNLWICFGGSYPGALSAWFRIKYPHLVHAAIASSAPVRAKVNFEGYNDVVAASLADPIVNGSQKCVTQVKEAFAKIDQMLDNGQLEDLAQDFYSCGSLEGRGDVYQFASNLADNFMGVVQYNLEVPGQNITGLCEQMTETTDSYANLQQLYKKFLNRTDQKCADNSWDASIAAMRNTTVTRGVEGVGLRQWIYQTCTQFGYYQSCDDNSTCPFSHHMALGPNLDLCRQVFGVETFSTYRSVTFTNSYYGADQPRGTRILFVNGSIDPWHALSILHNLGKEEMAIFIQGTAHCANMHSDEPTDPPQLRQAKQKIDAQIGAWLKTDKEPVKSDSRDPNVLYFNSRL